MFSSFQSSTATASTPSNVLPVHPGRDGGMDDVAFGCECADPSLQIDCWGQEAIELAPVAGATG